MPPARSPRANSFTDDTWGKPTTTLHAGYPDLGFRFLYVGEFDVAWDDQAGLGLAYMHARHYSPVLGRFLQPDPDGSEANLYAYTANNPVTELDPDGTCFILCAVVNAVVDTAIYLATTDSADWNLGDAAMAAGTGAVTGFLGVGLLSKVTKIGAVAKVLSKVPKAGRVTRARLAKPGEDLYVGPYGASSRANRVTGLNRSHTPHHAPQDAVSGLSRSRGITINLRRDLHAMTRTYGRPAPQLPGGRRSHLAADVRDLRGILQRAGYPRSVRNQQLLELIRQNKQAWGPGGR